MKNLKIFSSAIAMLFWIVALGQEKNFIDKPFIEVQGKADTLVTPNRIYIDVFISEKDVKNKKSVEELESDMLSKLKTLGIEEKNITMQDMMSNFKKFFLKQTEIQKAKSYSILVYDAKTTAKVFIGLEEVGISNIRIDKLEHSDEKKLQLLMNSKAIVNAKANAISFTKPLGQTIGKAIFIGNVSEGILKRNLAGSVAGVTIRGNTSLYGSRAMNYESNIEFEKISISSEIDVRFALE
jgi:hypothetical protein